MASSNLKSGIFAIEDDQISPIHRHPAERNTDRGQVSSSGRSQLSRPRTTQPHGEKIARTHQRHRRSLLNLCLGLLGRHLEHILDELPSIGEVLPASLKMTLLAVARRRGLLGDDVLLALIDESWETLDVSGSDVTDLGMKRASAKCHLLKAVDVSRCSNLTAFAVQSLVQNCPILHTLRCGGTSLSNATAKKSLFYIVPGLNADNEAEDSWENLELEQLGRGAQALRWLVWPAIDEGWHQWLSSVCPKVVTNPALSPAGYRSHKVPQEALPDAVLDDSAVIGLDPETWAIKAQTQRVLNLSSLDTKFGSLSIAERFRLAFAERDERLASKRAKNVRQNQRRAEKAWLESDADAKAILWAGVTKKSFRRST